MIKTNTPLLSLLATVALGFASTQSHAESLRASDNAGNYSGGWTNGSNGGVGFGPWQFEITQNPFVGSEAGVFIGDPGAIGISGMAGPAFGLYAYSINQFSWVRVWRSFSVPLQIGEKLRFSWGINWDGNRPNGNKGFNLYVANNEVINVNNAGDSSIAFNGENTGFAYGTQAMIWTFERLNASTLRISANGRDGIGQFTRDLDLGNSAINALAFYASDMEFGPEREPYFNNLEIYDTNTVSLSVSPTSLSGFSTASGSASAHQSIQVSGTFLGGDITVSAPEHFEVASESGPYGTTLTIPQSGGNASAAVRVRLATTAPVGPASGNLTLTSLGVPDWVVPVSGTVVTQFAAGYEAGRAGVAANPSAWNLFTRQQYDAAREAGRGDVTSNPALYNLHTADSIMDMNLGGLMIQSQGGGNATLRLQLQSTPDLATMPFENDGAPIEIPVQMDGTKGFLRIRALGPQ